MKCTDPNRYHLEVSVLIISSCSLPSIASHPENALLPIKTRHLEAKGLNICKSCKGIIWCPPCNRPRLFCPPFRISIPPIFAWSQQQQQQQQQLELMLLFVYWASVFSLPLWDCLCSYKGCLRTAGLLPCSILCFASMYCVGIPAYKSTTCHLSFRAGVPLFSVAPLETVHCSISLKEECFAASVCFVPSLAFSGDSGGGRRKTSYLDTEGTDTQAFTSWPQGVTAPSDLLSSICHAIVMAAQLNTQNLKAVVQNGPGSKCSSVSALSVWAIARSGVCHSSHVSVCFTTRQLTLQANWWRWPLKDDLAKPIWVLLGNWFPSSLIHFCLYHCICQEKFASLSLAFKTDALTLDKRIELHHRARDIAEQNIERELDGLKEAMKVVKLST